MDFKGKRVAIISTTDDMLERFMPPHIKFMVDNGAIVDCYCRKTDFDCVELERMENVQLLDVPFTRFPFTLKNLKGYKKLKKSFKTNSYDFISCLQPVGGFMGRMMAKKFKIPTLYTAHGFHFYKGCSLFNKVVFKNVEKYCSKFTDVLVTMNEEDYQNALKFKAKKAFKINGIGVDLSKYCPNKKLNKKKFKSELGLEDGDFVVTSVGELNDNKNTFRLLEVIKSIDNPQIKYLVCGQGPLKEKFEKYILDNGLQDRVKMLGFRKDIPDILTITDLYIMPSYREGLSKSMMEAMCYGLPVVASKIRGNVDLLGDNEGGILCSPEDNKAFKDAILKIYENKELREILKSRNLEFIKNYDISVVLKQMEEIYKEV